MELTAHVHFLKTECPVGTQGKTFLRKRRYTEG